MSKVIYFAAMALLYPWPSHAEETIPSKFYKLDFVVQEMDGTKALNSREYSAIDADGTNCSIRTTSTVPYHVGEGSSLSLTLQSYTLGVSIDASHLRESDKGLSLTISADVFSVPLDLQPNAFPITRKNTWNSTLVIPLRKQTVIFSSDDVSSKHKIQLLLTATPLK